MLETYFELKRRPFLAIPDVAAYFASESIELARQTAIQVLERGSGITLVFGNAGTGKSLLLRMLEHYFSETCSVIYVANPRLRSPKALYQHLLFSLHQSFCGAEENELRLMFVNHISHEETNGLILLIDESQTLPRTVLEELRVLMHCDNGQLPKIRLLFAGNHQFEERLTHPHLTAFQQRVVARCYLENFNWKETQEEILWQLKCAGHAVPSSLFLLDARKLVHQLTEGIPRVVHQLCEQTLALASANRCDVIDKKLVQSAWALLQQISDNIPAEHVNTERNTSINASSGSVFFNNTATTNESTIEFGTLDDSDSVNNDVNDHIDNVLEEEVDKSTENDHLKTEFEESQEHLSSEIPGWYDFDQAEGILYSAINDEEEKIWQQCNSLSDVNNSLPNEEEIRSYFSMSEGNSPTTKKCEKNKEFGKYSYLKPFTIDSNHEYNEQIEQNERHLMNDPSDKEKTQTARYAKETDREEIESLANVQRKADRLASMIESSTKNDDSDTISRLKTASTESRREKQEYQPDQELRDRNRMSCQNLLHELVIMEELLAQEISVIHKMKKIENDCISRRIKPVAKQIFARFPETTNDE